MATVIGVCLAAPLEIRVLATEIRAELAKSQGQYFAEINQPVIAAAASRKAELKGRIDKAESVIREHREELEKRRLEINAQSRQLELEAEGLSGSGKPGRGSAWRDKEATLKRLEDAMPAFTADREREIARQEEEAARWKQEISAVEANLARTLEQHRTRASHKDGLMERIRLAHEIGGWVPYWITALLLCIEVGPIFFKMMLVKGAYDYLEEDRKKLIAARAGIQPDAARLVVGSDHKTQHVDVHHGAEALLAEERRRLETEGFLSAKVHEEYRKRTAIDIEKNLDNYLEPPVKN
jgi:hypothetical protein